MTKKFLRFISIVVLILFLTPSVANAAKITLDEATFNQLVTRAKEADTLEEEKDFYKTKYEEAISRSLELQSLYNENITLKDKIISEQKELVDTNLERIKTKDDIISLQDKKISKLEKNNLFKNILLIGVTVGGVAVAAHNDETGAAVGIAAAGALNFLIK